MKLFVDDIRTPDNSWHTVRTVTEAIRAIARYDFDIISLDHDISHQVQVGEVSRPYPCSETFLPVAYYIALKYKNWPKDGFKQPKVILHTSNQVAGEFMWHVLKESGIIAERAYMAPASRLVKR